jgi:hypothetical protein
MKMPRFRIAWLMIAVALAALDFAGIRAFLDIPEVFLLVMGALPTANVLVVGILIGQQRPSSRPFLLGFETFGAIALVLFVAFFTLAIFFPDGGYGPINSYLVPVIQPIEKIIGQNRPFVLIPIACFAYVFMLCWPQMAFALVGGLLSRRYRITITKRSAPAPADT